MYYDLKYLYLHESVPIWEDFLDKRQKSLLQDLYIYWGIHYAFKDANTSSASHANANPYMHLYWMLCPIVNNQVEILHVAHIKTTVTSVKASYLLGQNFSKNGSQIFFT